MSAVTNEIVAQAIGQSEVERVIALYIELGYKLVAPVGYFGKDGRTLVFSR